MTIIDQQGMPHGEKGLYAPKNQSEPEVHLESRDEGTFLFPPTSYRDVQHYADFWMNAPISDGVLSNITAGYNELMRVQVNAVTGEWRRPYDIQHEKELTRGSRTDIEAATERRTQAYNDMLAGWHADHPAKIRAGTARTIARVGQLVYYTSSLSDEDAEVIRSSTVAIGDQTFTCVEAFKRYQLGALRDHFQDPDITSAERLEDLRQELRNLRSGS